jgi:hypothetical protein
MKAELDAVPIKVQPGFTPGIGLIPYAEQARIAEQMQAQDSRFLFYALRVMNDEVWNFIDGQRSIGEIAESVCMEFGFELEPGLFLPLVQELVDRGLIRLEAAEG